MNEIMNELINDDDICRTAPATPGLLTIAANDTLAALSCPFNILLSLVYGGEPELL